MYEVSQDYLTALSKPARTRTIYGFINDSHYFDDKNILEGSLHITNRCSEGSEIKIGSVYIGELTMTLRGSGIPRIGKRAEISLFEGLLLEDGITYEYVPLGLYYVSSAVKTASGIDIVADDRMYRLNKRFPYKTLSGSAIDFLKLIREDCNVNLGVTKGFVDDLPNGDVTFKMYADNDIETYRDLLYYVAQYTMTFGTINRLGELELRRFGGDSVDTLTPRDRYEGGRFDDFETSYSAIALDNIKDEVQVVYGDPSVGDTLVLGANPFLQGKSDRVLIALERIISHLPELSFSPFEISRCAIPYDLGDEISLSGGLVGQTARRGCVMMYDYTFHKETKFVGYGSDSDLAHAKSSTDKAVAGLKSKSSTETAQFYQYTNTDAVAVGATKKKIINIRFVALVETIALFQAEILVDAADGTECKITYRLDNQDLTYIPQEKWISGHHVLSLFYPMTVDADVHSWDVFMECDYGGVEIPAMYIKAVIWGQGLLATDAWNGRIDAEDEFASIVINTTPVPDPFVGTVTAVDTVTPYLIEAQDTVGVIPFNTTPVPDPFVDALYVNKDRLSAHTWAEVAEYTWAEIEELFNW